MTPTWLEAWPSALEFLMSVLLPAGPPPGYECCSRISVLPTFWLL